LVGLLLLAAGLSIRLVAASYRIVTIDMYTFVPAICGVFILLGGWSMFRWAWAPLMFLIFMYPLPDEATRYLLGPLQTTATMVSTFALQTLGLEAYREGNQIVLGEMHLGVVDACSGLRMLTIFCALSVGMVMVGRRSWWENAIILASAIPIALLVNSVRITVTGVLFQVADSEFAEAVFHDWAGLVMMPMAMAMLYAEQYVLANVFLPEIEGPAVLGQSTAPGTESSVRKAKPAAPAMLGLSPIAGAKTSAKAKGGPGAAATRLHDFFF
jgi:exosortase